MTTTRPSQRRSPRATTLGVARDHARLVRDPHDLVATILRTRSVHAREILVELAWPGRSLPELVGWARGLPTAMPAGLDVTWVGRLGGVIAVQSAQPSDTRTGLDLLLAADSAGGLDRLVPRDVELLAQLLAVHGDHDRALRILSHPGVGDDVRRTVEADLAHPRLRQAGPAPVEEDTWLGVFGRALSARDAAPVRLARQGATRFDRLACADLPPVDSPFRVTVLMTSYRPVGAHLRTTVRSVLQQTWTNLELILVDDASGPDVASLLAEIETGDPRVTVVRKAVAGGTYRARNTALRLATGDFVTALDAEAWAHPQLLELAVARLLADPGVVGTRSRGVRVTDDLQLTRPGDRQPVLSAASLVTRMDPVVSRVGFFDPAARGADTEYARRIEVAFGRGLGDVPDVLTFYRSSAGSLSAWELSRDRRHPARHAYTSAYEQWHARLAAGAESTFLDPQEPRRFPQPVRWEVPVVSSARPRRHWHVVFGGDWRRDGGPQRSMLEEVQACREAGLRVGVMHLEAFRLMTSLDEPLCEPVRELIAAGAVQWVHPDDDADVDVLMIRSPPVLQYPPTDRSPVRVGQLLVMANQAPLEPDGSDQRYCVTDVTRRAEETFGVPPVWVPQSPRIRRVLLEQDPAVLLADWDHPCLIDVDSWRVAERPRPDPASGGVVVGRWSRDDPITFPRSWADTLAAYDLGPGYRVLMMGGFETLARLAAQAGATPDDFPASWELHRSRRQDPRDFLASLDVVVYQDNPDRHEAFGRVLLEAAASGVVTIAHPRHESTFGEALVYADPADVREVLDELVRDPVRLRQQSHRAVAHVRRRFGRSGFAARMVRLAEKVGRPAADRWRDTSVALARDAAAALGPEWGEPPTAPWVGRLGLQFPVRSGTDGERSDAVAVVLADGLASGELARVRDLVADALVALPEDRVLELLPAAVAGEPAVRAVLTRRDGSLRAAVT